MAKNEGIIDDPTGELEGPTGTTAVQLASEYPGILDTDPEAVSARMAERMKGADTLDELFDALTGKASDSLIGKAFEFIGVTWQPYQAARGVIPLAVVEGVDLATGEETEFVTTGAMLVQFLRRAQVLGAFPFKARIVGKKTNSGQTALNFERV